MDKVEIVKCWCGHSACDKYGLNTGTFYVGSGWPKEEAAEIAHRLNSYDILVARLEKVSKSNHISSARLTARATLDLIQADRVLIQKETA